MQTHNVIVALDATILKQQQSISVIAGHDPAIFHPKRLMPIVSYRGKPDNDRLVARLNRPDGRRSGAG